MSELDKMFQEDAEAMALPTSEELTDLSALVKRQLLLIAEVDRINSHLKLAKERLEGIQMKALPDLMTTIGVESFTTPDGRKLSIKDDVRAGIRSGFTHQAVAFLDSINLGDIVKDEVKVSFGRGEKDKAKDLLAFTTEHGFNASETLSVHPQTLKAAVKGQLKQGISFPEEFFTIQPLRKAIIK